MIVCIVDDDDDVRESIENLLRSAGFESVGFDNAENFVESPMRCRADCVVTDVNMPGMSGLDLLKELKRSRRELPVIIMTAFATDCNRQEADEYGASAFMTKPIDGDDLVDRLEELLG